MNMSKTDSNNVEYAKNDYQQQTIFCFSCHTFWKYQYFVYINCLVIKDLLYLKRL